MTAMRLIEIGAGAGIGLTLFLVFGLVGVMAVLWAIGWIRSAKR